MKKNSITPVPKYIMDLCTDLRRFFGVQTYDFYVFVAKKDERNAASSINIKMDYQRLYLTIYPCFFENSRADQRLYLLHEFSHHVTEELSMCINRLLDGKLVTEEERRVSNERATSRIAALIETLLTGKGGYARKSYSHYLRAPKR